MPALSLEWLVPSLPEAAAPDLARLLVLRLVVDDGGGRVAAGTLSGLVAEGPRRLGRTHGRGIFAASHAKSKQRACRPFGDRGGVRRRSRSAATRVPRAWPERPSPPRRQAWPFTLPARPIGIRRRSAARRADPPGLSERVCTSSGEPDRPALTRRRPPAPLQGSEVPAGNSSSATESSISASGEGRNIVLGGTQSSARRSLPLAGGRPSSCSGRSERSSPERPVARQKSFTSRPGVTQTPTPRAVYPPTRFRVRHRGRLARARPP
jgi:hypothetical protein